MIRCFDTITAVCLSSFYQVNFYQNTGNPGGRGRIRLGASELRPVNRSENFLLWRERRSRHDEIVGNQIRQEGNWAGSDKSERTGGNRKNIFRFSPRRVAAFCASPRHLAFKLFLMRELRVTDAGRLICHHASVSEPLRIVV